MYLLEEMIDHAVGKDKWPSNVHRQVAINLCIGNPNITTMDVLIDTIQIINLVPEEKIQLVTIEDLRILGCTV